MKKETVYGRGVCGVNLVLSLADMYQSYVMVQKIDAVIKREEEIKSYDLTPYDKRVDAFGNKTQRPEKLELNPGELEMLSTFFHKIAGAFNSTIFEEEDEEFEVLDDHE